MKKSLLISSIVVATAAFVFSSCDSRLDVLPTQTLETGASLKTVKDLQAYLVGCYDGLQTGGDTYSGGFMYTSELLGNDGVEFRFGGTFSNLLEIDSKAITRTNSTAENTWVRAYNTINRCNTILANLDKTTDKIEPETKDLFEGEASFIRGAIYFELTRLYGKQWGDGDNAANPSVPLVTTPTTVITDAESRPRANVAAIYAQVISDLTKAEAKLPAKNGFFVNKWAASGLLSRVYLQQGNYMAARDAASKVIESAQFSLTKAFKDAFNSKLTNNGSNPSEYIFAVQVSDQDGTNGMNTFFGTTLTSVPGTSGRGDMRILAPHIALYDSLDVRGKFFVKPSSNTFTYKFVDRFGNIPVLRLAEMYLTRAECNSRLSTVIGAKPLDDINLIRTRAGLAAATAVTLDDILKQRRLELAFEGFRLHDIKRLKTKVGALPWNDNKLVMPVPQREIDVNKQLVQNAGY